MKLPNFLRRKLVDRALALANSRAPDFVIGDHYLERWFVIPRNPWFNIYLHQIAKSDDDRALHDHPWWNVSVVLVGGYWEHSIAAGGVASRVFRRPGSVTFRRAKAAHRLEIGSGDSPAVTLFITGPRIRQWGFHCPNGWRHWKLFTAAGDAGQIGRGCGEHD